jgi:hypothetical protein
LKKNKEAPSSINSVLKDEIEKENWCKKGKKTLMSIWVTISYS